MSQVLVVAHATDGSVPKPTQELLTLARRFGDCKDKALLTVTLLRALGVQADPVLVNTDLRDTLAELQAHLAEQGHRFGIGTLWRFFARHGLTWKKRPRTRRSRSAPTS